MLNMKKNKSIIIISWIAVFLWMIVIFLFSNMNANSSSNTSSGLIKKSVIVSTEIGSKVGVIKETPDDKKIDNIVSAWDNPIRKLAHFTEYLILAILVCNALFVSGVDKRKIILFSFLVCFIYASSDEIHQIFINGRAGRITDVFIDTLGSMIGSLISNKIIKKKCYNKKEKVI